jgi:hypothetical protein
VVRDEPTGNTVFMQSSIATTQLKASSPLAFAGIAQQTLHNYRVRIIAAKRDGPQGPLQMVGVRLYVGIFQEDV